MNKGLKEYNVGDITTDSKEKSITIQTSIEGSSKDTNKLASDIEETAKEILNKLELKSVSNITSFEIKIRNANSEILN
ncbi:hypothetical protein SAMN05421676_1133 [Salinibacillus kushneri]|uniref:Uncharacterized protein n=1 Tax=Salinibacillus kushneri TaxID=237682 RepID=A0A1I0IB22_9BACI|nr:hypothetical protein [Salinibacillus kushneri]SET93986.1 hypothetical protein SAMN05421676_11193 [Salinibacillus kushneri]SET97852.1 hypothetical protein SAMN05421676_1133 [Salinibacillus kushneri]